MIEHAEKIASHHRYWTNSDATLKSPGGFQADRCPRGRQPRWQLSPESVEHPRLRRTSTTRAAAARTRCIRIGEREPSLRERHYRGKRNQ